MKPLTSSILVFSALFLIPVTNARAGGPDAFTQAFPEDGDQSWMPGFVASAELVGGATAALASGEASGKIHNLEARKSEFDIKARLALAKARPENRELLEKKARLDLLGLREKLNRGLNAADEAEMAALKKEMKAAAPQLAVIDRIVVQDRRALMGLNPIWTPKGDVHAENYFQTRLRNLRLGKAALLGGMVLMVGDAGRRGVNAFTGVSSGVSPAIVTGRGPVKQAAPSAVNAEPAAASLSVE